MCLSPANKILFPHCVRDFELGKNADIVSFSCQYSTINTAPAENINENTTRSTRLVYMTCVNDLEGGRYQFAMDCYAKGRM